MIQQKKTMLVIVGFLGITLACGLYIVRNSNHQQGHCCSCHGHHDDRHDHHVAR